MAEQSTQIHWIEVRIKTSGELAEPLAEVLGRFVSNGVVIESITQYNPIAHEEEPTGDVVVFGYLPADDRLEEQRQKLNEALWYLGRIAEIPEPVFSPIHDENWMSAWKVHYQPIRVGATFLILPAWMEPDPNEQRRIIRINPAMAFGTGTHPTTQLILELLEKYPPTDKVIDVGCGTGILSIAALRMGAKSVLAVDIDRQSVVATQESIPLNAIDPTLIEVGQGSVEEILTGRFSMQNASLVLVNILAPIIMRLLDDGLADLVSDGGILLLSGLLDHQEQDILRQTALFHLNLIERRTQGDWVSLAFRKAN